MSKRLNRKFSISRRIGASLWGDKKDPQNKRNYPPGVHGRRGIRKSSNFGKQLLAKQKIKKYYGGITERQFFNIFIKATAKLGDTRVIHAHDPSGPPTPPTSWPSGSNRSGRVNYEKLKGYK